MLACLRDPSVDPVRRDRIAVALLPFCHPRLAGVTEGKKEQAAREAIDAGKGTQWEQYLPDGSVVNDLAFKPWTKKK